MGRDRVGSESVCFGDGQGKEVASFLESIALLAHAGSMGFLAAYLDESGTHEGSSAYSAQFGQVFRSIPVGCSGDSGRGRSEATLEFFS